jgi:magnesium transporter
MNYSLEELIKNEDVEVASALLESLNREEQQSYFSQLPNGFSLWFRYLKINNESLEYGNLKYLYLNEKTYKYSFEEKAFQEIANGTLGLIEELENYLSRNEYILKEYLSEVENLEDLLYERKVPSVFMDIWFDIKKDLSRIDRFLERQNRAIISLSTWNKKHSNIVELEVSDLLKSTQYLTSNVQGGLSRLDSLHHYYSSIKNDKLNKNIYLLTILSGIFLPLNLVVGFFGMNTKGLFFDGHPEATLRVVYILISIVIVSILSQAIFKLLDRFIIRTLLGKTPLYKNISKGLIRLEKSLGIDL